MMQIIEPLWQTLQHGYTLRDRGVGSSANEKSLREEAANRARRREASVPTPDCEPPAQQFIVGLSAAEKQSVAS